MSDALKITSSHLARLAIVYLRQSSAAQVEHNRESTDRQYALVNKAGDLGWPADKVVLIDEDLGVSGSGVVARSGFARLTAEVALGHVGLVLGLEVSRLARNNADWYRLIDLCGLSNTLIGDADGIYHPALFNDRLLLGLKGTMSEAELYILRARLNGGIRNKAARGELRRGLPVGLIWTAFGWRSQAAQTRTVATPMAKSDCTPTKPCGPRSPRSSPASPRPVRRGGSGCGSDPRDCACRRRWSRRRRSCGSTPVTTLSIRY